MYLLDTNVISELRKARAGKADRHVAAWAAPIPLTLLFVSVITIHELEMGVLLAERRDPRQGRLLRRGWTVAWWRDSALESSLSIQPSYAAAHVSTFRIHGPFAMRSLRRRLWSTG